MLIRTERLDLVAATLTHIQAELESATALGRLLEAEVPSSWPPGEYDRSALEFFCARLSEDPHDAGWYGWYAIRRSVEGLERVLIGAGGYLGPPGADGIVEVGYSIAPEFQARGYATEMVDALVVRAFAGGTVTRVIANTTIANAGSIKVLEKCGFTLAAHGSDPEAVRYEVMRPVG